MEVQARSKNADQKESERKSAVLEQSNKLKDATFESLTQALLCCDVPATSKIYRDQGVKTLIKYLECVEFKDETQENRRDLANEFSAASASVASALKYIPENSRTPFSELSDALVNISAYIRMLSISDLILESKEFGIGAGYFSDVANITKKKFILDPLNHILKYEGLSTPQPVDERLRI